MGVNTKASSGGASAAISQPRLCCIHSRSNRIGMWVFMASPSRLLRVQRRVAGQRHEKVNQAGANALAQLNQMLGRRAVEQACRAPQLAVAQQRVGGCHRLGRGRVVVQCHEAAVDVLQADRQGHAAFVQHDHVAQQRLHLLHLVGGDQHAALAVAPLIDQHLVEALARHHVQAQGRLIQDHQLGVDGRNQRQMRLRHHALGQALDLVVLAHARALEQRPGALRRELGLQPAHQRYQLTHPRPARQHRHVGDIAQLLQQLLAVLPRPQTQHRQVALHRQQAHQRLHQRGLASAVVPQQADDAALGHLDGHIVQRRLAAETQRQMVGVDQIHVCSQFRSLAVSPSRLSRARSAGQSRCRKRSRSWRSSRSRAPVVTNIPSPRRGSIRP
mmetsp:Transcript_5506/g.13194  ORF Transcript_5506/g.13194 Transcript_5506/m.13194 type:complete len:387 (-) Transcript_5506:2023-3183(-)